MKLSLFSQSPGRSPWVLAAAVAFASAATATAQTTTNLTLYPNYPGLQGAGPVGIDGDSPTGWENGSWRANVATGAVSPNNFTSINLSPMDLFGRDDVRVDELASVSYYTKKAGAAGSVDWFFQFYTKPYAGSPGSTWYGHRINAEPYFSQSLNAPANQWNQWQTDNGPDNRLRFYDSSNNYFGGYSDPFLDSLAGMTYPIPAWNLNSAYNDLGPQEIMYFNLGLGTAWAGGFLGQIDGIRIELTDGSVAYVNLENFPAPAIALNADASCYNAGVGDTVTVAIDLTGNSNDEIVGGQFFLQYDSSVLSFVSAVPGGGVFDLEVYEFSAIPGLLDYAVGVTGFGPGTSGDATMAVLTFTALQEVCDVANLIEFRFSMPPTRLTDNNGSPIDPDLADLGAITIDGTNPTFTFVPSGVTVECDDPTDPANTGGFATATDNCDASPVVDYSDDVAPGSCPQSWTITRTWTATDACGNSTSQNQVITVVDTTAPVFLTVPGDITVNAEAGYCSADVDVYQAELMTFDSNPTLSPTQAPGVWYTDRYAPFGFVSEFFDGDNRLKHSIDASDCSPCRGGSFTGAFYDTQGRKYDIAGTTSMSIELYVPADWATTDRRMAGFWGTAFNAGNVVSLYPIVEFTSDGSNPRFRVWPADPIGGGWVDLGLPTGFVYDEWYTLEISINGNQVMLSAGDLTYTLSANNSVEIGNVILQGHNNTAGVTYDIYWDNLAYAQTPMAVDNCDAGPVITYERSDNSLLTLNDPFPAGVTTITWTATDACGNFSTATTDITVNAVNEFVVDVELLNVDAGPFTRCITFRFQGPGGANATVSETMTFTNGLASATILVPCGNYTCVDARDTLHTLATSQTLVVSGMQYTADFTGAFGLEGGNLNDDAYIDILDFGIYVGQFNANYGTADTTCSTTAPHADISGDGFVTAADFSFIANNFLQFSDVCPVQTMLGGLVTRPGATFSGAANAGGRVAGPVTRISVRQLQMQGLGNLAIADLNGDGWLDEFDVIAFLNGARP
ncbi:MAG TPA: cohesin domain-containing protein [Phycisphaerales bacterium]|nr:cohesin domain-containing protein [Phycisphaerales bacterium]HRQ74488.1 cohesin domain-containing protein [Phycisphaerales bacterium]